MSKALEHFSVFLMYQITNAIKHLWQRQVLESTEWDMSCWNRDSLESADHSLFPNPYYSIQWAMRKNSNYYFRSGGRAFSTFKEKKNPVHNSSIRSPLLLNFSESFSSETKITNLLTSFCSGNLLKFASSFRSLCYLSVTIYNKNSCSSRSLKGWRPCY